VSFPIARWAKILTSNCHLQKAKSKLSLDTGALKFHRAPVGAIGLLKLTKTVAHCHAA
jgi:hypothetical protein